MGNPKQVIIDQAFDLKHAGKFQEAVEQFQVYLSRYEEDAAIVGIIAGLLHRNLNQSERALPYARRAVELSPKKEFPSFLLTLCLFTLGLEEEMEIEMKRFFATGLPLNTYNTLLEENNLRREDFM